MHLRSARDQIVSIQRAGISVPLLKDEMWTEMVINILCKRSFVWRGRGFRCGAQWVDGEWPFAENLLIAE